MVIKQPNLKGDFPPGQVGQQSSAYLNVGNISDKIQQGLLGLMNNFSVCNLFH